MGTVMKSSNAAGGRGDGSTVVDLFPGDNDNPSPHPPIATLRRMLIRRGLKAYRMVLSKYSPGQIYAAIKAFDEEADQDDIGPGLLFRFIEWGMEPEATLADVVAETLPHAADARAERDPLTEDLLTELEGVRAQAVVHDERAGREQAAI